MKQNERLGRQMRTMTSVMFEFDIKVRSQGRASTARVGLVRTRAFAPASNPMRLG
jgi:hypothetical protein